LERVKGIEPSSSAWKAVALPLSYTRELERSFCVREPAFAKRLRRAAFALGWLASRAIRLVGEVGLEPTKA
jgi:hypothetical protein